MTEEEAILQLAEIAENGGLNPNENRSATETQGTAYENTEVGAAQESEPQNRTTARHYASDGREQVVEDKKRFLSVPPRESGHIGNDVSDRVNGKEPQNTTPLTREDIEQAFINAINSLQKAKEPTKEEAEKQEVLKNLDLQDYASIREQVAALTKAEQEKAAEAEAQKIFNDNLARFEKEFNTIKPENLAKFAKENGVYNLLNTGDYSHWALIAKAMQNISEVKEKPDNITDSGTAGNSELGAFERLKKGEKVSDIELGAELLKGI